MNTAITVSTFPHMKSAEQKKISSALSRRLNPNTERRAITTADMARILAEGGSNG